MTTIAKAKSRARVAANKKDDELRVLLATAGDPQSLGAVWVTSALTRERGAEVLALGVAVPFPHTFPSMFAAKSPLAIDEGSRLQVLKDVEGALCDVPGTDEWSRAAINGWPSDAVSATARSWRASLIVVGLGEHGRLDRLFGTETAIGVMKHATIPVLAVNADARELPRHGCVAIDFTPASLAAAAVAADLLGPHGKLTLLHACAFVGADATPGDLVDVYRAGAKAKLDHAVAALRRRTKNTAVHGVMTSGEPAETILDFASREHCDLIALGGHEQGLVDRILLGSVRTRVLRSAKCSVLIAPPENVTSRRKGRT
jgi:nucleotide-binding universal stress UspA family protein